MKMKLTVAIAMSILSIISCTGVRVNGKSLTDIINNSVNGNVSISIGESGIDASDNYTTRTVRIESLKGIKTGGVFEVKYTTGEPSLTIYAPDNVQEHIITRLENGILTVKTDGTKFKGRWEVTLNVSSPTLEMLDLSGACEFEAESGVCADNLDIDLSGAVEVDIDGLKAEEVSIKGSGASDIDISGLDCDVMKIRISGAGEVDLEGTVQTSTDINISGAGDVNIKKLVCDDVNTNISGAGKVRRH